MTKEAFCNYCCSKKGVEVSYPFDAVTMVMKVSGKMFALLSPSDTGDTINLKCDPEKATQLRERYAEITAGYHMNKKHWNTLPLAGSLPNTLIQELLDHSYELVVKNLPKKIMSHLYKKFENKHL